MPRDALVLTGLTKVLERLPNLSSSFFEANNTVPSDNTPISEQYDVVFAKKAFTRSGFRNIYYTIEIRHGGATIPNGELAVYVNNPVVDVTSNRRAVESAVVYLAATETHIRARDVDANDFAEV